MKTARLKLVGGLLGVSLLAGCGAPPLERVEWKVVPTGIAKADLTDVAFADADHGLVVGSKSTILSTEDGGKTWKAGTLKLATGARFLSVSLNGTEGWISGEPKVLLHSVDSGKTWTGINLDRRLPGSPLFVTALSTGTAEVVLNSGLVIKTTDGGKNWRVMTPASAGGIRSAQRLADGSYWVVSLRGGSYLHWVPGEPQWTNYERSSSRRIQSMGFGDANNGWMINQGGEMQFTSDGGKSWTPGASVILNGIGLLDAAYSDGGKKLWVSGGNGTLLLSEDNGKSWKSAVLDGVKTNLLNVYFFQDKGFVTGQNGILLKHPPT